MRKFGFINTSGQWVVEPIFDTVHDFNNGLAAFQLEEEGKWGYIDRNGCVVVEPQYDNVGDFSSDGLAWVKSRYEYYYINPMGLKIIGPIRTGTFNEVYSFNEGLAGFCQGEMRGYMNRNLQIVIKPTFDFKGTGPFQNGLAHVRSKSYKFGLIDKTGQFVLPPIYDFIADDFHESLLQVGVEGAEGKMGYVDATGKIIIEPKFEKGGARPFAEGLAAVKYGKKWGYIDNRGRFIIEPKFEGAGSFHDGIAAVRCGTKWGYIDKSENFVIEPQFDYVWEFYGDYAYVENGNKKAIIDKKGQILFEPKYERAGIDFRFNGGMAVVKCGNKYGYIDKTRKIVIDPIFDEAYDFQDGIAKVGVDLSQDTNTLIAFQKLPRCSQKQNDTQYSTQKPSSHGAQTRPHGNQQSGCYIATAVYGSYDCPEVWTLRRYRDNVLDNSWYGRWFIRCYYAISPTFVKWFGKTNWFRNLFRKPLNKWVSKLNKQGFENTPYKDKY